MKIEFDRAKSEKNEKDRGLPFSRVEEFEWETAILKEDARKDYGETRMVAVGFLDGRLHFMCFRPIEGGVRVISFRKANRREVREYEAETVDR